MTEEEQKEMDALKAKNEELEEKVANLQAAEDEPEEEEDEPTAMEEEEDKPVDAVAMIAAFSDDKAFAAEMIEQGKTIPQAQGIYAARVKAENAKLQAKLDAIAGGVEPVATKPRNAVGNPDDPKAKAEAEWESGNTVFKASSKERYIASRVSELNGNFRVFSA